MKRSHELLDQGGEPDAYRNNESDDKEMDGNDPDHGNNSCKFFAETEMSCYVDENAFDEEKAYRMMAKFFCSAALPPKMVDDYFHRKMMRELNPHFHVRASTVGKYCLETYEEEKAKVKQILRSLDGQISLSVDILCYEKRYVYVKEYLCITAHFVDHMWKLKKWILNFSCLWERCDPVEVILETLKDWDIENKISTITTGNDKPFRKRIETIKGVLKEKKELQLDGRLFRVYCCGNIISQMVQRGYKEIDGIIEEVRELHSFGRSLPLWYHTIDHLKEALALEASGEFSSQDVRDNYCVPSAAEWEKIRSFCNLVDRIHGVANLLFEAKYATSNIYFHHLRELQTILVEESTSSDGFISSVTKKMLKKFDKYWNRMYLVLAISMVMDPRFKMKYIEFSSSNFVGSGAGTEVASVLEAMRSLYNNYLSQFPEAENFVSDSSSSESEEDDVEEFPENDDGDQKNPIDVFKLLPQYNHFILSSNNPSKSDLDLYLEESVLPWRDDFSALTWWRTASSKYPTLSRMARDFLAIPISLATSYEAFYTEPRGADERIISSGRKMMNVLMCTRSWYPWPQ